MCVRLFLLEVTVMAYSQGYISSEIAMRLYGHYNCFFQQMNKTNELQVTLPYKSGVNRKTKRWADCNSKQWAIYNEEETYRAV